MNIFRNIRLSTSKRLFVWLLGYSLLMVVCFVAFQYHRERQFKVSELNARLQTINSFILNNIAHDGLDSTKALLPAQMPRDIRVSIIADDGRVVYDTSLDSLPHANHLSRDEIVRAKRHGEGYAIRRHSESTGGTYFYSAKSGNGYIVRTAMPYTLSLNRLLSADYGFMWFMLGVTVVMCAIGYFATRREGINEQLAKERMRRQLTNNINHELKTPLASIQVCIETLTEHPDLPVAKRQDFLQRCAVNVQRLRRLLSDVSTITRLDNAGDRITRQPVDLAAVVAETCSDLELSAESKGMIINNSLPDGLTVNGNAQLLSSVFHNLIENAIAYSGGSEVTVALDTRASDARTAVITVADDGVGVDRRHLPRLFERFYRVDKGRSRQAGGTGLGLSIVKNAVVMHGGTVSVQNRPGGGLLFTLTLPRLVPDRHQHS